jgi:hypothetical protein
MGALFWFLGRNVRKQVIPVVPQPAQAAEE